MNNKISFEDVADLYLMYQEKDRDALEKVISSFPQYANDLREFAAFQKIENLLPNNEYTDEQEEQLNNKASKIIGRILR